MGAPVFSCAGSRAFDAWMAERLEELAGDVRSALGENLVALILGGGYGRGEGGVVGIRGQERPYNDLDLIVIVHRRSGVSPQLEPVSRRHRTRLGIDVDFSRPLTLGDVQRWEHRLRWHDLYHGHHVLVGAQNIVLDNAPRHIASPVPGCEAARLLINRGAGLVWARRVMNGLAPAPDPDFVRRNAYKALLAAGDAYLIGAGVLAPRHEGRQALLTALGAKLPPDEAARLLEAYSAAVRFKFAPDGVGAGTVDAELVRRATELWAAAFLRTESTRHGRTWQSLSSYARWAGPREPAPATRWLRNLASNLRFGQLSVRAPQEPLYAQVATLLDPAGDVRAWDAGSEAFLRRWHRVND